MFGFACWVLVACLREMGRKPSSAGNILSPDARLVTEDVSQGIHDAGAHVSKCGYNGD